MTTGLRAVTCVFLALWVYPLVIYAQADMGTIAGTVTDTSGAVITNAVITVTELGTNTKTTVKTDVQGSYIATPLRVGNYSLTVETPGFKTETRTGIVLRVQDRLRVDFTLQIGSVNETVNVHESAPVVDTDTSALGDVISSRQITDLPLNGRDYTQLATLTTGVVKITENGGGINGATTPTNGNAGGAFSVNGTRGNLNNFLLDGVDNNSNDNAGNILHTNVDAIQEFKVQTSNYSA
jgi:Carboxypeptidase regulatory-like domain